MSGRSGTSGTSGPNGTRAAIEPPDPLDQTLSALADPQRRAIIDLLRHGDLRPSEVAERLQMARPALSRHLRVLREAGIVEQQTAADDARSRPIRLRREPFGEVRDWIASLEAHWDEQLLAFKAHAEASARSRRQ
ncbi:MAG: metalloregulator ArsR/SmtB family transcription factor [Burkholderiaceae bacterium]